MSRHLPISEIRGHGEHNGLYRLADSAELAGATVVPGATLSGKAAMLDAISKALDFPDYFGANWDALEECLTDLSWLEGGVVLLIDNASWPEEKAPEAWGVLLDILSDAARFWAAEGKPFAVFLKGSHAAYPIIAD